jgi:hypothetical protein
MKQVVASAYFPSLAYVRALLQQPDIAIDLHEHFVKQSIRTRAEILSSNGVIQLNLHILHNSSGKQTMQALKIDYSKNWQAEHWRAIESAYANAPYFEHYAHDLRAIFNQKYSYVYELNHSILLWINQALGLELKIEWSPNYTGKASMDKKQWLGRSFNPTYAYQQVFSYKTEFIGNLSVLDGLFNEGPLLRNYFLPR